VSDIIDDMSYEMRWARRDSLAFRAPRNIPRTPTLYERVRDQRSFYESVGSTEHMPELSPARVCWACGHDWVHHGGECSVTVWLMVGQSDYEQGRCRCRRTRP
jgi:hypothetical protein